MSFWKALLFSDTCGKLKNMHFTMLRVTFRVFRGEVQKQFVLQCKVYFGRLYCFPTHVGSSKTFILQWCASLFEVLEVMFRNRLFCNIDVILERFVVFQHMWEAQKRLFYIGAHQFLRLLEVKFRNR